MNYINTIFISFICRINVAFAINVSTFIIHLGRNRIVCKMLRVSLDRIKHRQGYILTLNKTVFPHLKSILLIQMIFCDLASICALFRNVNTQVRNLYFNAQTCFPLQLYITKKCLNTYTHIKTPAFNYLSIYKYSTEMHAKNTINPSGVKNWIEPGTNLGLQCTRLLLCH